MLQYLYRKYGRDRAAITGVVTSYRPKSAIRDVGKALGYSLETVDAIAKGHQWCEGEEVVFDYASLGLTLRTHPMALLRPQLKGRRLMTAGELDGAPSGRLVHYVGIVTLRQQPETANGTVFISLEDETGVVQVICWKSLRDAQRKELLRSRLLLVHGVWQREGDVKSLIAGKLEDLTPMLGRLATESRDFK